MVTVFFASLCLHAKGAVPDGPSSREIAHSISLYAKAFTFQKVEANEAPYLTKLGQDLTRFADCSEATAKRVCEILIVPTATYPDSYGFEKGIICRLWLLLRYKPKKEYGTTDSISCRKYHGDIRPPASSGQDVFSYDYPWSRVGGRWKLRPFMIGSDARADDPLNLYDTFSKLPRRALFKRS